MVVASIQARRTFSRDRIPSELMHPQVTSSFWSRRALQNCHGHLSQRALTPQKIAKTTTQAIHSSLHLDSEVFTAAKPDGCFWEKTSNKVLRTAPSLIRGCEPLAHDPADQPLNLVEYPDNYFITPFYYGLLQDPSLEDPLLYMVLFDQADTSDLPCGISFKTKRVRQIRIVQRGIGSLSSRRLN